MRGAARTAAGQRSATRSGSAIPSTSPARFAANHHNTCQSLLVLSKDDSSLCNPPFRLSPSPRTAARSASRPRLRRRSLPAGRRRARAARPRTSRRRRPPSPPRRSTHPPRLRSPPPPPQPTRCRAAAAAAAAVAVATARRRSSRAQPSRESRRTFRRKAEIRGGSRWACAKRQQQNNEDRQRAQHTHARTAFPHDTRVYRRYNPTAYTRLRPRDCRGAQGRTPKTGAGSVVSRSRRPG